MNIEKKLKSQKGKSKTSEGRKQLSSVRVIQRNLVYVVGLPLNLADEDVCIPSIWSSLPAHLFGVFILFSWSSFSKAKIILVNMERCWRCLYHGQLLVLYNILQIVRAACKFLYTIHCSNNITVPSNINVHGVSNSCSIEVSRSNHSFPRTCMYLQAVLKFPNLYMIVKYWVAMEWTLCSLLFSLYRC